MNKSSVDRRKGPDVWVKIVRVSAILGWSLFIIALIISFYAAPDENYGIVRYYNVDIRHSWIKSLTWYLYIILWVDAFLSFGILIVNHYRSRRINDSKLFNLVLLFVVSVAWFTYIFVDAR